MQTSAAPVSMSDRINKLQKGCHCFREIPPMVLLPGDLLCVSMPYTPLNSTRSFCMPVGPETGAYFLRALNPECHSQSNLNQVPIPKIMPCALTPDWIFHTFSDILGPGFGKRPGEQTPGQSRAGIIKRITQVVASGTYAPLLGAHSWRRRASVSPK